MRQLEEDILISHYTDLYEDSLLEDGSGEIVLCDK